MLTSLVGGQDNCGLIYASPGAGKSTYASKLFADLVERNIPVVRHHYFLSLTDSASYARMDHQRAAESLMHDLQRDHSKALGQLADRSPNPQVGDLRAWLEACGSYYAAENKSLVVIIDGLDHVWRERRSIDELDRLLGLVLPPHAGLFVLFVSQPVHDDLLPSILIRAIPRDKWTELPLLDESAIDEWLRHHLDDLDFGNGFPSQPEHVINELVAALHRRSQGHPLHLCYTVRAIQERRLIFNEAVIASLPACPRQNINDYYGSLWHGLPDQSRSVLHLLASTHFSLPRDGIHECLDPERRNTATIEGALTQIVHLLSTKDLGLQPFHGSLLVFVRDLPEHSRYDAPMQRLTLAWLHSSAPEYWKWAYEWLVAAELGDDEPLIAGPDRNWTVAAIAKCRPKMQVCMILEKAIRIALERDLLPRAMYLGHLLIYYCETRKGYHETPANAIYARLRLDQDSQVRVPLRSGLAALSDSEIQLLAEAEGRLGDQTHIRQYIDELSRRIWGGGRKSREISSPDNTIDALVAVAAQAGGRTPSRILQFAARNRNTKGSSRRILRVFCEQLRIRRDVPGLRALLQPVESDGIVEIDAETALTADERLEVIHHLLLLSLEEGTNCDAEVRELSGEPFALVFAAVRPVPSFLPNEPPFPDVAILNLERHRVFDRQGDALRFFVQSFWVLLSNQLCGKTQRNSDWVATIGDHSWAHQFVTHLDRVASVVAEQLLRTQPMQLAAVFCELGRLPRPQYQKYEFSAEYLYSLAAGRAVVAFTFDLRLFSRCLGGNCAISKDELQATLACGYCERDLWIDTYLGHRRPTLSVDAVTWLLESCKRDLESSLEHFAERAARYASLAPIAALHNRRQEAEELITAAADNLLTHGYHKDTILDSVLDAILVFHSDLQGLAIPGENPRDWLFRIAPAIAHIDELTDGDGTRYLPRELATALRIVAPELLPNYCRWLTEIEEYGDAQDAFEEFIRSADLKNPIAQAVAHTAVDPGCIKVLSDRASNGESAAADALTALVDYVGNGVQPTVEEEKPSETSTASTIGRELPPAVQFAPDNLSAYIDAVRASAASDLEEAIKEWIKYWVSRDQREPVYKALQLAVERGFNIWVYDELYELAVEVEGRERAYRWLERANKENNGWSVFRREELSRRRWEIIRANYPLQWYEFIRNTLLLDDSWYGHLIEHGSFVRVVKYLIVVGHNDLARQVINVMVNCAVELVSPADMETPGWVNTKELGS